MSIDELSTDALSTVEQRNPGLKGLGTYEYGWSDSDAAGVSARRGLSEEVVRDISGRKNEPQWMLDLRLKGLKLFGKKPMPSWGSDLTGIDFDNIKYFVKSTEKQATSWEELPEDIRNTYDRLGIPEAEKQRLVGGVAAQYESEVVYHQIREDLAEQGVIFVDTDTGLREHEDLFREYFTSVIPVGANKFAALNTSVWSGGSFISVPPGVKVDIPLQAYFRINTENMGQFERTLIIADEGSYVHYVEGCTAPIYKSDSLHSAVVEIIVKENARVRYTTIQNWSNNVYNLVTKRATAGEGATMEWVDGNIGSKVTMKYPAIYLMGEHATGETLSIAFAGGVLAHQVDGRVLHGHFGPDVPVHPLHGGALAGGRPLGDQVVHVVRPVLDGRVPHPGVLLHDDLDDRGVQRVAGVDRRGAALDVVHVGPLVGDDQGPLELAHVLGVDPEVGLQRDVDVHARWDVDERPARPHSGVQRRELVVPGRDHRAEVLLEDLRVLAQAGVGVQEEDALLLKVLTDLVVDDLGLVLGRDAGHQALLLGLRDAQAVVGLADVVGQVLPAGGLLLGGPHEVLDVVEVDARQVGTPVRHRLLVEQPQRLEPGLEHPLRLVLERRDVPDDLLGEPTLGGHAGGVGVVPAVPVAADRGDDLLVGGGGLGHDGLGADGPGGCAHDVPSTVSAGAGLGARSGAGRGMCVVQTWPPPANVDNRWTCTPSRLENSRASASHSCG